MVVSSSNFFLKLHIYKYLKCKSFIYLIKIIFEFLPLRKLNFLRHLIEVREGTKITETGYLGRDRDLIRIMLLSL